MKFDPKKLTIETAIWDMWTKNPDGTFRYLGRGSAEHLQVHMPTCEAADYVCQRIVLDTDTPPTPEPGPEPFSGPPAVVLRPPYWDEELGVVVHEPD